MRLQTQINLIFLAVLTTAIVAMVFVGTTVIEDIVVDLNTQLMKEQLQRVKEDIDDDYAVLQRYGLEDVSTYARKAQEEVLLRMKQFRLGESGRIHVFNRDGSVLFPTDKSGTDEQPWIEPDLDTNLQGKPTDVHRNVGRLWVRAEFAPWNWIILVSMAEQEILLKRDTFILQISMLGAVVLLGAWMAGILLSRALTQRIAATLDCVQAVEHGDLGARVSVPSTRDELGQLQLGVNAMTARLAARMRDQLVAEDALRASESKYRRLHETMREAFVSLDMNGQIRDFNEQFCDMVGYGNDEVQQLTMEQITPARWNQFEREILDDQVIERGYSDVYTKELRSKAGSIVPVELRTFLLTDDVGRQVGTWSIIRDITERKEAEIALQRYQNHLEDLVAMRTEALQSANRELEAFSYSVSHDLRTPLRGIDGFSQALLEDYSERLDERGRDYLSRIRKGAQRMARLIDDLLTLARVGRAELSIRQIDLSSLAQSILLELQHYEPEREVQCNVTPGMSADGDPVLLHQVLFNLFQNAWKFTKDRKPGRIDFGTVEGAVAPTFYVRDNGVGFDMRYVNRLFKPFQRLHGDQQFEGTGIGLATVARVIQRHGGTLRAEGRSGEGATFYFTLPATVADKRTNGDQENVVDKEEP